MSSGLVTRIELEEIVRNLNNKILAAKVHTYLSDDLGGVDFTTAVDSNWEDTGIEFSYTPSINCYFVSTSRVTIKASNGGNIYVRIFGGENIVFRRDEDVNANDLRTRNLLGAIRLNANTAYTIKIQAYFTVAGTLTIKGETDRTKLEGFIISR